MKSIFRYTTKDAYLILYALGIFAVPYYMAAYTSSLWLWAIVGFFQVWFIVNAQNSSLHHHAHLSIFNNSTANRVYEAFISAVTGTSFQTWRQAHLLHHKYVNDPPVNGETKDPVSVYKPIGRFRSKNGEPINFWIYCFVSAVMFNVKYFALNYPQSISNVKEYVTRCRREQWTFRLYILSIALVDFKYGLFMMFVYFMSYAVNNANSYGEHWGTLDKRGDTTRDSVGIYSDWYNWFGFNAGLHQEHHHKPGVHWTKLPEVTKLLPDDRYTIKHGVHITNNPFWSHFKLLFKKNGK